MTLAESGPPFEKFFLRQSTSHKHHYEACKYRWIGEKRHESCYGMYGIGSGRFSSDKTKENECRIQHALKYWSVFIYCQLYHRKTWKCTGFHRPHYRIHQYQYGVYIDPA